MNHWDEIAQTQYSNSDLMMDKLKVAYKRALRNLDKALSELYLKMLEDGEVSSLTLYKEDRYMNLYNSIAKEVDILNSIQKDIMQAGLSGAYRDTFEATADALEYDASLLAEEQIERAVAMNWLGRNFSDSIETEKKKLFSQLNKSIIAIIILGKSKDDAAKILKDRLGASFSNADRLVRTETMFIINQSQKDAYVAAGYTQYKIMATLDSRTSEICRREDGNVYSFADVVAGVNYPPLHCYCRSTVIPII